MAGSGKVAINTREFLAGAVLEFPPDSKSMVAQRFPSTIRRSSRKEPPLVRPILIPPGSVVSTLGDGWFSETKYFLELTEQAWHRKRLGQIEDVGSALGTEQCDTFSVSGHENRFHDRTLFP